MVKCATRQFTATTGNCPSRQAQSVLQQMFLVSCCLLRRAAMFTSTLLLTCTVLFGAEERSIGEIYLAPTVADMPFLIGELEDDQDKGLDYERATARAIARVGHAAIPSLIKHAQTHEEGGTIRAWRALYLLGKPALHELSETKLSPQMLSKIADFFDQYPPEDLQPFVPRALEFLKQGDASYEGEEFLILMGPNATHITDEILPLVVSIDKYLPEDAIAILVAINADPKKTIPALRRMLAENLELANQYEVQNVITAVAELGPPAEEAVSDLISLLEDNRFRRPAIEALGKIGPAAKAAIPRILALLQSNQMYDDSLRALVRIGPDDEAVIREVIKQFRSSKTRCRAIEVLDGLAPEYHDTPLTPAARRRDEAAWDCVFKAVASFSNDPESGKELLFDMLANHELWTPTSARLRRDAAAHPQLIHFLIDGLATNDEERQRDIVSAFTDIGAPALPMLAERLRDPKVRQYVVKAIEMMRWLSSGIQYADFGPLISAYCDVCALSGPDVRYSVYEHLAELTWDESKYPQLKQRLIATLTQGLREKERVLWTSSLGALESHVGEEELKRIVSPVMWKRLAGDDPELRMVAARWLVWHTPVEELPERLVPVLTGILKSEESKFRFDAAQNLGTIAVTNPDSAAFQIVLDLYKTSPPEVRAGLARTTIDYWRPAHPVNVRKILPLYDLALNDEQAYVRAAASDGLIQSWQSLSESGWKLPDETARTLAADLKTETPFAGAVARLLEYADPAIAYPALTEAMENGIAGNRVYWALSNLPGTYKPAIPGLIKILQADKDEAWNALPILAKSIPDDKRARQTVISFAINPRMSIGTRIKALWHVSQINADHADRIAIPLLYEIARDPWEDGHNRATAIRHLVNIRRQTKRVGMLLHAILHETSPHRCSDPMCYYVSNLDPITGRSISGEVTDYELADVLPWVRWGQYQLARPEEKADRLDDIMNGFVIQVTGDGDLEFEECSATVRVLEEIGPPARDVLPRLRELYDSKLYWQTELDWGLKMAIEAIEELKSASP